MKKLLSLLLAISTCLSCGAIFGGCKHEHNYEWQYTEEEHWCWCTNDECYEYKQIRMPHSLEITTEDVSESTHKVICSCGYYYREDHNFDSGIITLEPSKDGDGIKTYTCESCGYKKEETEYYIPDGSVVSTVFASAIAMEGISNYRVSITDQFNIIGGNKTLTFNGNNIAEAERYEEPTTYYTMEGTKKYVYYSNGNGGWNKYEIDSEANPHNSYDLLLNLLSDFAEDLDYHDFTYVGEYGGEGYYTASNITASNFLRGSDPYFTQKYKTIEIYFADNLLTHIKLTDTYGDEAEMIISYDSVNVTIPTV